MSANFIFRCYFWLLIDIYFSFSDNAKSFEFSGGGDQDLNFSNWAPNEFVYVDIPNRIVIEVYGHAFLEDGYYFLPWIIIWKHNDDFPLLEKHNDAFANKFSNKPRAKRSNAEDGTEKISSNLQDISRRCSGLGQVVKIPEIECCSISPVNPVAGPIYFASNCSKDIAKVRKKRFF